MIKLRGRLPGRTTNRDLFRIAALNKIQLDAVCFKDELVKLPNTDKYIIMNMSTSDHNGTHWTAIAINDDMLLYSDSFGIICPKEVIQFAEQRGLKKIIYTTVQIQHEYSESCGEHSLVFLKLLQDSFINAR
jgi:hypothetical protein